MMRPLLLLYRQHLASIHHEPATCGVSVAVVVLVRLLSDGRVDGPAASSAQELKSRSPPAVTLPKEIANVIPVESASGPGFEQPRPRG